MQSSDYLIIGSYLHNRNKKIETIKTSETPKKKKNKQKTKFFNKKCNKNKQ